MPLLRPSQAGRFRPEALFRPKSVAVIGAGASVGTQLVGNLLRGGYGGTVLPIDRGGRPVSGVLTYPDVASLPIVPDLALLADDQDPGPVLASLAARGTYAAVSLAGAPGLAVAARAAGVRVLGPQAFGVCVPAFGLNASTSHLQPKAGRIALVSQSAALCRAVLDWAEPNGVGFSHVIGIGGAADAGFALVLDWLARDPGTGAILLDIRTIRDRRGFLSAAKAASRMRPVVAIRAGGRLADPAGFGDRVFDAALRRAGVVRVSRFSDLLAAAETLTRARPAGSERLAIVTNAVGPGQMAADAALAAGLQLIEADGSTDGDDPGLAEPASRGDSESLEGRASDGIVWTGADHPSRLADAALRAASKPGIGGVLAILSPQQEAATGAAALAALQGKFRLPFLTCALGETTGASHRMTLAEAGIPTFASPELAVRGFEHLVQDRRARAAARELPPSTVLDVAPDREEVGRLLATSSAVPGGIAVSAGVACDVLMAYGLLAAADRTATSSPTIQIRVQDDPVFGPAIGVAADTRARAGDTAWDLPPLNLPLASALAMRADTVGALVRTSTEDRVHLADALVRVSQLVVDFPAIRGLEAELRFTGTGIVAVRASIVLHPAGELGHLAIAPYPAELTERFAAGGEILLIRPIRPEDAEAHAALFRRLTPEDIRYRFFSALRDLPPEQVVRMTQVDYDREMAFVAVRAEPGPLHGQTVGVARIVREGYADTTDPWGEFAVVVQSDLKGRGLGRRLMQCLIEWGRALGLAGIEGQVLADNAPMVAFVRALGFEVRRLPDEPDVVEARYRLR